MDDFGNLYQTEDWFMYNDQYGYSAATFGMFDDAAIDLCLEFCTDHTTCDI